MKERKKRRGNFCIYMGLKLLNSVKEKGINKLLSEKNIIRGDNSEKEQIY